MDDAHRFESLAARLRDAGADDDELATVSTIDGLVDLSIDLGIRPPGPRLSLVDVAHEVGISLDDAREILRTVGLPVADPTERRWVAEDVQWLGALRPALELFGPEATFALLRRTGLSTLQLAHGTASIFRVGTVAGDRGAIECEQAVERNLAVAGLIERYVLLLAQVFRHQSRAAVRTESVAAGSSGELRDLCVGFVDVTSSTRLASTVTAAELAALVADFERAAFDAASTHGARVVKTIGDEVMFCADDAAAVCAAALEVVDHCQRHHTFVGARGGVALGPVLDQAGDCYGPVVNQAARFVERAADGTVMADAAVVAALGASSRFLVEDAPSVEHRGLGRAPWWRISVP